MNDFSINTKLIHAGERRKKLFGKPVATPIYATATYTYDSMAEMDAAFAGEGGDYIYSRYGNPTVAALEDALAIIENGKLAVAFGFGNGGNSRGFVCLRNYERFDCACVAGFITVRRMIC